MKIRFIAAVCVVIAAMLTYSKDTTKQHEGLEREALGESMELVSALEKFTANEDWIGPAVERAHSEAFKLAFRQGRPRTRLTPATEATFDKDQYLYWMFNYLDREVRSRIMNASARENLSPLKQFQIDIQNLRKSRGIKGLPGTG